VNAFVSVYLPALVLALGSGIIVPALPTLARSFGVSFGVASSLITVFLIGNVAGTIPTGWFVDRFGRRLVMILGPLLTALLAFLVAGANTFPELLVFRFLGGVAAQMWLVARLAAISYSAAPDQRGRQITWMFGMDNAGRLLGPLIGGFVAARWGLRAPFVAYGVLAGAVVIPALLFARDIPRQSALLASAGKAVGAAARPSVRQLIQPRLAYFAVVLFASLARGPIQADLLHLYAAFAYRLGPQAIGYLAASAGVISVPIGLLAGAAMDRLGRKKTMVPGLIGMSAAMVGLAVTAFLHLTLGWYVALFLVGIAAQALCSGSVQTLGADIAPPHGRGMFLGLWRFTGTGAAALAPALFSLFADQLGYGSSFLFIAITAAVASFLIIGYIPETHRPNPQVRPSASQQPTPTASTQA
jgi:MFS family permease